MDAQEKAIYIKIAKNIDLKSAGARIVWYCAIAPRLMTTSKVDPSFRIS